MSPRGWEGIWAAIDARARFGMKPGLERMRGLLERLGRPDRALRCIQVAGTNGKGTTAYALSELLRAAGGGTGLFVSPHLRHPAERIRVNGHPLDEAAVEAAWAEVEPHLEAVDPSYFELLTALALTAFRRAGLRWAVLECGLGGRLDATSAVTPELAILTNVGADHLDRLGPTLADVARDKAHVAPPGGLLLCAEADAELQDAAAEVAAARGARLVALDPLAELEDRAGEAGGLRLPADTRGWRSAAGLALAAAARLGVPVTGVVPLHAAAWPGRFQILRGEPPRLLDVAHNPPALGRLAAELGERWPGRRFNALLAGMRDKDLAGNLAALRPILGECRLLVLPGHPRAATEAEWTGAARRAGVAVRLVGRAEVEDLKRAVAGEDPVADPWVREPLVVTGSFVSVAAWLGEGELPPGL